MELAHYRQRSGELLDEFVTRCSDKAKECDFTADELSERILELVIVSTPFEALQKELLDQPKGYGTDEKLKAGRKYEAIATGRQSIRSMEAGTCVNAVQSLNRVCRNCVLSQQPKKCPAYNDMCKACGKKGHWHKLS